MHIGSSLKIVLTLTVVENSISTLVLNQPRNASGTRTDLEHLTSKNSLLQIDELGVKHLFAIVLRGPRAATYTSATTTSIYDLLNLPPSLATSFW